VRLSRSRPPTARPRGALRVASRSARSVTRPAGSDNPRLIRRPARDARRRRVGHVRGSRHRIAHRSLRTVRSIPPWVIQEDRTAPPQSSRKPAQPPQSSRKPAKYHPQSSRKPAKRAIRDPVLQSFSKARSACPGSRKGLTPQWLELTWFLDSGSLGRNDFTPVIPESAKRLSGIQEKH